MPGPLAFRARVFLLAFFAAFRRVGPVAFFATFFTVDRTVRVADRAALLVFFFALRAAFAAAVMASSAVFAALRTVFRTVVEVRAVLADRVEVRLRVVFATMGTPLE